eukprot:TRINITY_DN18465_c0_g1_i1.p1 TRINITY_DN18465_c0_g1~~TRINITY_DN18465_c0_g1_i1.p1  ORF type:complete len:198 (+),score=63.99 TRINITY_DN18465_c0_g1_i1:53-595(+)
MAAKALPTAVLSHMSDEIRMRRESISASPLWHSVESQSEWRVKGDVDFRERMPEHFALGLVSQVTFRRAVHESGEREYWVTALGPFTTNSFDHAQGGAIATIFDVVTGFFGSSLFDYKAVVHKSLAVRYLRPVPAPGLVAVEVSLTHRDKQSVSMEAKMHVGGKTCCECSAELVPLKARM